MSGTTTRATRRHGAGSARASTGRAAWGTITRARVIDAATELVRARGYEQLTVRALAAELGVAPMSLYRHVRDKDDLLGEVVDRLLASAWRPAIGERNWRAWIVSAADRLRGLLVAQPAALHVYLAHPVISPAALARMDAMMGILRRVVGEEDEARRAYGAIHTYTIGFAALEASRSGWQPPEDDTGTQAAHQLAAYTTPAQFTDGLNYLLEAITTR